MYVRRELKKRLFVNVISDTESVASLTDAEMDKLIRDASRKVLKVADKPTKVKKKVIEKVIKKVVHNLQ